MTQVYTIGYEGTDIDRFVAVLQASGVQLLADVRALPLSRKKGFSKTSLKVRLEKEGIGYVHLVALGNPKQGREAARAGRYDEFRKIYARQLMTEQAQEALSRLAGIVQDNVTCLLCFERDPSACHRSIIGAWLTARGVDVFHLQA